MPDGLTRAQWAAIKGEEAAKKAQKKEKPAKIETLEEWQVSQLLTRGDGDTGMGRVCVLLRRDPLLLLPTLHLCLQEEFENGKTGHRFAKMKFDVSPPDHTSTCVPSERIRLLCWCPGVHPRLT